MLIKKKAKILYLYYNIFKNYNICFINYFIKVTNKKKFD